jgi:hypothetical protein
MKRVIAMLSLAAFLATTVPYVTATDTSHKSTMVAKKHKKNAKTAKGSTYNSSSAKKSSGSSTSSGKSNASSMKK